MEHISESQIRLFRLHAHHLDCWYQENDIVAAAGACGFQNSPPGAWETAAHNRIKDCTRDDLIRILETDKILLQAWSFRGVPVVFPVSESPAFLSALVSKDDEPWIYTQGIQLALDLLQMQFSVLLEYLKKVMPKLDGEIIKSKTCLDQTLADWMLPLLPADKRELWSRPSMYGNPDRQTVGGAVVSFLLRPCSFERLVVFGKRAGSSPTFTSYQGWIGHSLEKNDQPEQTLVRKFLHCYGPAVPSGLSAWLGCSPAQAARMWKAASDQMIPVSVSGKQLFILSDDISSLVSPPVPERKLHLLGGHDPYLGLFDREIILTGKRQQRQIWQTVSNPGAVLLDGKIAGMWKSRKKGKNMEIEVRLWDNSVCINKLNNLIERHAAFYQCRLQNVDLMQV